MKRFYFTTGVLILIFSIFFTSNLSYSQSFQIFNTEIEGMANGSVNWVDVNNDGRLDIFICGRSKTDLPVSKLYLGSNGTEFIPSNIVFTPVTYGSASWGDYDNDGDLDLLLTGFASDKQQAPVSKIYRNDLPGGFTDISAPLTKVYKGSSSWGDYDNDGDLDCVISGLNSNGRSVTKVYRNDKNDIFSATNIHIAPVYESTLSFCDIDNDKDNDLIVTGLNNRFQSNLKIVTRIYKNHSGSFIGMNVGLTPVYNGSVSCGDYNSDGFADILLTGSAEIGNNNPFCITKIYKNEDGMIFSDISANLPGIHSGVGLWGDYDNDGDLDILLSGAVQSGQVDFLPLQISTIFKNNSGSFEPTYNVLIDSLSNCSGAWGDFDNDSDLDIILAGSDKSQNEVTRIYNNQSDIINNLPVEPDGLTTTVDVNNELDRINLMWLPSTDYETPQKGLTYNLRVGTTHGGSEIMSPNSNPRNGLSSFPAIGNVGYNTSWLIKDLAPGKYYWSVQSVDNTFQGSDFAPEGSFMIAGSVGITLLNSLIPEDYLFEQNYPNPFNPKTNIRFSIPQSSHVRITVYDVSGNEVGQLVNMQLSLGNYEYHWDAIGYSSGIYFYRIQTEDFIDTKKMVLIK